MSGKLVVLRLANFVNLSKVKTGTGPIDKEAKMSLHHKTNFLLKLPLKSYSIPLVFYHILLSVLNKLIGVILLQLARGPQQTHY